MSTLITLSLAQIVEEYVDPLPFAPSPTPPKPTAYFGTEGSLIFSEFPNGDTTYALFYNCTEHLVDIIWITYDGTEQIFKKLKSGCTFKQTTISNHPWIARDTATQALLCVNNNIYEYAKSTLASNPTQLFITNSLKELPIIAVEEQESLCAICFEEFWSEEANNVMVVTDCSHGFCIRCLIELCKYHHKATVSCPYCRNNVSLSSLQRLKVSEHDHSIDGCKSDKIT